MSAIVDALLTVDHEMIAAAEAATRHCRECEHKGVKSCSACVLHALKKGSKRERSS